MSYKSIKTILQALLLSVIVIIPFIKIRALYFPFISGKVYSFRLLVYVAFLFFIWLLFKKDPKKPETTSAILPARAGGPYKNILVISLGIFLLVQVIVSLFGVSPEVSFFSTVERQDGVIEYGFWVLYFLMLLSAFKNKLDWKIFFSTFIATALAVSFYSWLNLQDQGRLAGVFGNPSYLAAYLLFAIGFCFVVIERKFFSAQGGPASGWENKFINIVLWVLSLFFALTLYYTQTRGAYLALAGAIFLFCLLAVLFLRKQNPEGKLTASCGASKKIVVSSAIILAIGIISVSGLFIAKDTNFVKNSAMLSRITEITQFWELGSIRERVLNWQIAIKAFEEKPILGYGPENFSVAFNKYYDFRIGRGDAWFDRVHNQFIEPLATGGVVLFSAFLFLLASIGYTILKISKKEKTLSFILAGTFLAYIIQGMFLFDTLPVYLGLFPFLAFVVYTRGVDNSEKLEIQKNNSKPVSSVSKLQKPVLFITAIICLFGIQTTVYLPYKASAAALSFAAYTGQDYYLEAEPFAKEAFNVSSPYTYWELRKRIGWQFLDIIDGDKKFTDQQVKDLGLLYEVVVPELERFSVARPNDPQMYYVLSRIYRLGYQKLGKTDLIKAKNLLDKALTYSNTRVEYYNEITQVLLLQGKFDEGEKLLKDYTVKMKSLSFDYFSSWIMGHYYYVAGKYDLAMESYKIAKNNGYDFTESPGEYSRYIDSAAQTKHYQEIVDMSQQYLKRWGPNADTYFNIALGEYYLGDKSKAKEFFLKAVELNKEQYQKYDQFFSY